MTARNRSSWMSRDWPSARGSVPGACAVEHGHVAAVGLGRVQSLIGRAQQRGGGLAVPAIAGHAEADGHRHGVARRTRSRSSQRSRSAIAKATRAGRCRGGSARTARRPHGRGRRSRACRRSSSRATRCRAASPTWWPGTVVDFLEVVDVSDEQRPSAPAPRRARSSSRSSSSRKPRRFGSFVRGSVRAAS